MFNAAPAYETYVVDVVAPDDAPDFEVLVHVHIGGAWHRPLIGLDETACSHPFTVRHRPISRREVLTERAVGDLPAAPLCSDCFTPREIARAKALDAAALERERAEFEAEQRRNDEFFAALKTRRKPTQGER